MKMETWKDIIGYEGIYQINNMGKIKSLKRKITYKDGRTKVSCERIIKPSLNKYYRVVLTKNNKPITMLVNRIVAIAFIPNPENKSQVNHINGIKTDNRVENLEWCTRSENAIHSSRVLNNKSGQFINGNTDLYNNKKVAQLDKTNNILKYFKSISEAKRTTRVAISSISLCLIGKRKTAGGFKWQYA